jgi:hypothetical protein
MYQVVAATFTAVATPWAANVLDPDVPGPARSRVSEVIAMVVVAPDPEMNTMLVPISNGTEEFAGIVTVRVVVVYTISPASPATRV